MKTETAAEIQAVAAPAIPKRELQLQPERMQLAEYQRNDWVVTAEQGTTTDDIINPIYFAHMAAMMKPYDHIEVRVDDGTWIADLLVLQIERNWARVKLMNYHELAVVDEVNTAPSSYEAVWKGPHLKWSVLRKSDKANIKPGFNDRVGAEAAMRDLERLVG